MWGRPEWASRTLQRESRSSRCHGTGRGRPLSPAVSMWIYIRNQPGNSALIRIPCKQMTGAGGALGPDRARQVRSETHSMTRIGKSDPKQGPGLQWTAGGLDRATRRALTKKEGKAL